MNLRATSTLLGLLLISGSAFGQFLGAASQFAVLGATPNVTNTGPTVVSGSVGVYPAASVTGFPPGTIVPGTGTMHLADAVAQQAQADNTTAYNALAAMAAAPILPALGGQTLVPGVYNAGAANLTGTLTLNGPGLYVIQATSLTTASGPGASAVVLTNGATACDVWWQIGASAAIGTFSAMVGNVLALTSITIGTSASLEGRALAQTGTVTLDSNLVNACFGGSTPGFIVPFAFTAVPTLSEWALIALAVLLAVVGFAALRRQQAGLVTR